MNRLKEIRKATSKTQKQVASDLGMAETTYVAYENQKNEPSLTSLIKIAEYFNKSVDYLLGRQEKTKIDLVDISLEKRELIEIINQLNDLETGFVKGYAKRILDEREGREKEERIRQNSKF